MLGVRFHFCHLVGRGDIKLSQREIRRASLLADEVLEPICSFQLVSRLPDSPTNHYGKDRQPAAGLSPREVEGDVMDSVHLHTHQHPTVKTGK